MLGTCMISGDATTLLLASNWISLGSVGSGPTICIHVDVAHAVIMFRHWGHCSAPKMAVPPLVPPPEAEPVTGGGVLVLLHAAPTIPNTMTTARTRLIFRTYILPP